MNIYMATKNILDTVKKYQGEPPFEEILIEVLKIEGWSSKQSKLIYLHDLIQRELKNNSKKQVCKMLMNNYNYSKSGAYNLIKQVQKNNSKIDFLKL